MQRSRSNTCIPILSNNSVNYEMSSKFQLESSWISGNTWDYGVTGWKFESAWRCKQILREIFEITDFPRIKVCSG